MATESNIEISFTYKSNELEDGESTMLLESDEAATAPIIGGYIFNVGKTDFSLTGCHVMSISAQFIHALTNLYLYDIASVVGDQESEIEIHISKLNASEVKLELRDNVTTHQTAIVDINELKSKLTDVHKRILSFVFEKYPEIVWNQRFLATYPFAYQFCPPKEKWPKYDKEQAQRDREIVRRVYEGSQVVRLERMIECP